MVYKYLLFIVLLVGSEGDIGESPVPIVYPSKVHNFSKVYETIRSHEGNYVNLKVDRGRETYGGISRRNFPDWQGWYVIDKAKPLVRHDSVPDVEWMVKDWYLDRWVEGGFEKIENFDLALNLFDFYIHSGRRTVELKINRVLAKYGCEAISVQGEWVPNYINTLPPNEFILHLKIERLKLFNYLVTKDSSQMVFLRGWYKRIESI